MVRGRNVYLDLTGDIYGDLTVICEEKRIKKYNRRWRCMCKCGKEVVVNQRDLRSGNTSSCGCTVVEKIIENRTIHGFAAGYKRTSEYNTWRTMIARCKNSKHKGYPNYGGKGITVCERWNDFRNFIKDMGKKPMKHYSLDRINNGGNYEPDNCRWTNSKKQANNRSNNISAEEKYLRLLKYILNNGEKRNDRTGVGTISVFSPDKMDFYLDSGYPLLTTKKMAKNSMINELLWFLSGSTNVNDLPKSTQKWWTHWAKEDGDLGEIYGSLWRRWPYNNIKVDQVRDVIDSIKNNPTSRRHIISTWHPGELEYQQLPPCHGIVIQFYVDADDELSCFVHQRSSDCFIGLPVNIASYSLFLTMIAQVCGLRPYRLSYSIGDAHIYLNHLDQVKTQLAREPYKLPQLWLNPDIKDIDDFKFEDIKIRGYKCHPAIKAPIAV